MTHYDRQYLCGMTKVLLFSHIFTGLFYAVAKLIKRSSLWYNNIIWEGVQVSLWNERSTLVRKKLIN